MQNDKRKPRRITIERISVTTILPATGRQKFFCNVCGAEVDTIAIPADKGHMSDCVIEVGLAPPEIEEAETRLLSPVNETKTTGEE